MRAHVQSPRGLPLKPREGQLQPVLLQLLLLRRLLLRCCCRRTVAAATPALGASLA